MDSQKTVGQKIWKVIRFLLIMAVVLTVLFIAYEIFFFFHGFTKNLSTADLSKYTEYLEIYNEDIHNANYTLKYMPMLKDCGEYTEGVIAVRRHWSMFSFDSYALFLSYEPEQYKKMKEELTDSTVFISEATKTFRDIEAEWNGYSVRPVDLPDEKDRGDVKRCLFLGFDDDAHRILFALYNDFETDFIYDLNKTLTYYFFIPKELK
ncbi:MAG: hypothetical protein K6G17_03165 [Oscillospiraceae bacterium]|nr:hypothetical protein [Oscillospiraceae bacterium]